MAEGEERRGAVDGLALFEVDVAGLGDGRVAHGCVGLDDLEQGPEPVDVAGRGGLACARDGSSGGGGERRTCGVA